MCVEPVPGASLQWARATRAGISGATGATYLRCVRTEQPARQLIRPAECAHRLGVHRSTVTRWVRLGLLPAWSLAGTVRIDWDEAVRILRQQGSEQTAREDRDAP